MPARSALVTPLLLILAAPALAQTATTTAPAASEVAAAAKAPDACRLLPQADLEALIEPRAASLLAAATTPADRARLFGGLGELYSSLKNYAAAERWHRQLVTLVPEQYPLLVGSLTRQERLAEAIAVCGEATKADSTARPAMVLTAALTEGRPNEQDFKQAAPIIAAVVAKFPTDVGLWRSWERA